MKKASEGVCLDLESRSDLSKMERHAECVNLALGTALARVHLPAVTAYAAARGVHLVDASIKVASYK
jgi:hypothetical protein